jgi:thiamine kinase-like enzyme
MIVLSQDNVAFYLKSLKIFDHNLNIIEILPGNDGRKNFGLFIKLENNIRLLVKQERPTLNGSISKELVNEWSFQTLLNKSQQYCDLKNVVNEMLSYDETNGVAVYLYLDNYQELYSSVLAKGILQVKISEWLGQSIALVHSKTFQKEDAYDKLTAPGSFWDRSYSAINLLRTRLTPEIISVVPSDYLKFMSLYQRYSSLENARLQAVEKWSPCCIVHNDLNVTNILIHEDWKNITASDNAASTATIKIIDWERASWGDPILDLGSVTANYVLLWLTSMTIDPSMSLDQTIRSATITLKDIRPSLERLLHSYLQTFPVILQYASDFFTRLVQYIGISILIHIQSKIEQTKQLTNSDIYALQTAKTLLCQPELSFQNLYNVSSKEFLYRIDKPLPLLK